MKRIMFAAFLPLSVCVNYACHGTANDPPATAAAGGGGDVPNPADPGDPGVPPGPAPTTGADAGSDGGVTVVADTGTNPGPDTGSTPDSAAPVNPIAGFTLTRVANGAGYVDSMQWKSPVLFFTVIDADTDTLVRLVTPDDPNEFRKPAGKPLGLALDKTKAILMLESHPIGRVVKVADDGLSVALVASSAAVENDAGIRSFDSPNDIVVRKDGVMFVTDPGYQAKAAGAAVLNRIYRITAAGAATTEATFPGGDEPNGVALSPDEQTLYVSFTAPTAALSLTPFVAKYTVAADGKLSGRTSFAVYGTYSIVDGLTTDDLGNVYVACELGVDVYTPAGAKIGSILVPAADRPVHTVRFGGMDRKSLYIGMTGGLYTGKTTVPGRTGEL